jgi:replication factor A1
MDEKIAPHVDEIIRALGTTGTTVNQAIIIEELARLLEFKVPLQEAKRSLLKKHGNIDLPSVKKLSELGAGERNIEVTARILEINTKVVGIKEQERTIFMGTMVDETGARSFTAWEDFGLEKGDVVKVINAYIRIWQGMPEINFGVRSKVEKLESSALEPLLSKDLESPVLLAELKEGEPAVHTVIRIMESRQQEINTKNGPRTIVTGIAIDSTAKLPFTSWVPSPELTAGNTVEIKNAYMRSWQGIPTINMGEFTSISHPETPIDDSDIAGVMDHIPIRLDKITDRDGAFDVSIEGNIISVRPGSGLITRCSECNRVIQKNICRVHGLVEGRNDMRIKYILDDGTGALTVVLDADLTRKVTGYSIEKAREVAGTDMNLSALEEEIRRKLMGLTMRLRGNMTKGEYGITLVASDVEVTEINPAAVAADLVKEIESAGYHSPGQGDSDLW